MKNKIFKKGLVALLTIAMVLGLLPVGGITLVAQAQTVDYNYGLYIDMSQDAPKVCKYQYDEDDGEWYMTEEEVTEVSGLTIEKGNIVLDDFSFSTSAPYGMYIYNCDEGITITLQGKNSIKVNSSDVDDDVDGLYVDGNLTFKGTGSLTVNSSCLESVEYCHGIQCYELTVNESATVSATAGNVKCSSIGILADESDITVGKEASLTGQSGNADESYGIQMANMIVEGTVNAVAADSKSISYGIYGHALQVLSGNVTATGGSRETCYGIYLFGDEDTVITGGSVKGTANSSEINSVGIDVEGMNASLIVSGGKIEGIAGTSCANQGMYVNKLEVTGGTVIGKAADAKSLLSVNGEGYADDAYSQGIVSCGQINISGGNVQAIGGNVTVSNPEDAWIFCAGMDSEEGSISISGGKVTAQCGTVNGSASLEREDETYVHAALVSISDTLTIAASDDSENQRKVTGANEQFLDGTEFSESKVTQESVDTPVVISYGTRHSVTIESGITNGTITTDKDDAAEGELVTITITPDKGYQLASLIFKVDAGQEDVAGRVRDNKFAFYMQDKDVTLTAVFEKLLPTEYAITVTTAGNGTASASATSAVSGSAITLTAAPSEGYRFKEWQTDSEDVEISENQFIMPNHSVTVTAVFEKDAVTPEDPKPEDPEPGTDDDDDYDDDDSDDSGSSGASSSGPSSGSGTASVPKTGVQDKGESKEFVKADGTTAKSEWVKQGDDWYYAGTDGKLKTGWFGDSDGEWYYLNKETSVMEKDWLQDTDGKWYYLDTESGAMKTGWLKDSDGDWYYLNQTSGVMETHWYQDEQDGRWYYLTEESGKMKLGWFKDVNGKWYYFNEKASQQSWFKVGSDWVYDGIGERPLGSMYRGEMTPDGYYVDETGAWVQ